MAPGDNVKDTIQIISDDTASDSDAGNPALPRHQNSIGKRKCEEDFEEKIVWDADSDDHLPAKPKRRKSGKRSSKGKAPANGSVKAKSEGSADQQADYEVAGAPDYLKERRQGFDRNAEILKEAGLLLPPEYSEFYFSDDDRPDRREERPVFDDSTGVKPCRPYEDVELEYSAGIIPAPIAQYLRDYQIVGVKFLHRLFVYQKGGILGDDMGLGKTVQVAAFLTTAFGKTGDIRDDKRMRKARRIPHRWHPRVLIVCPGSLTENWKNELNRWGWWHVELYHGTGVHKEDTLNQARAGTLEIMVTTYHTYKNHASAINTVQWDAVVADECHALKRGSAEITQAMDKLNALCRIGLTGTAIQNNYSELWTLLNWTNPGHFGSMSEWENNIAKPLRLGQSHDATLYQLKSARVTAKKLVTNLLPRFFLRRMKTLIADQLPKKSDRVVFCPLTDEQRDAYQNFTSTPEVELLRTLTDPCRCGSGKKKGWCCGRRLPNGHGWQTIIFPCVVTLQKLANHLTLLVPSSSDQTDKQEREMRTLQACCPDSWDYLYKNRDAIVNLANPEFCGKWKVLKKLLKFWHDNGDKVLVFSHSVRLLRILQHLFRNTSYNVTYLDGSLSYPERQQAVDNFNCDPMQFVFLISTKAGGVGLNITAANKVVIVDPHWNPSYDLQAQDRAYRIGQRRDVDVFRLVSSGTIEEIVYARQIYKQQQANIGYTASSERRYFKGVQEDVDRQGEIFGLSNLFTFRDNQLVIREIVNKTNIAEAKAGTGINLAGVDMEQAAGDEQNNELSWIKREAPDGAPEAAEERDGVSQLAALAGGTDLGQQQQQRLKSDAIQAILSSAGVEYSHENSEVVGTSKVEEKLSRAAEMADQVVSGDGRREGGGGGGGNHSPNPDGHGALFADELVGRLHDARTGAHVALAHRYNPPEDVMRRQFCSMAREFGFEGATQFALVVESWTQEQRRNCLEAFYRIREGKLLAEETVKAEEGLDVDALLAGRDESASRVADDADPGIDVDQDRDRNRDWRPERLDSNIIEPEGPRNRAVKAEEVKIEAIVKSEDGANVDMPETKGKAPKDPSPQKGPIFVYDSDDDDDEL